MERDQLLIQKGELQVIRSTQDNLNRSERKKELLLRENEKLKADFKTQKRNSNASQLISNPGAMNFMRNTLIQTTNVSPPKFSNRRSRGNARARSMTPSSRPTGSVRSSIHPNSPTSATPSPVTGTPEPRSSTRAFRMQTT